MSVHEMKFEVGGLYDQQDDDKIPIDVQFDSFIEQITGKEGHFNISSSLEGIENQKNEKGRNGIQITTEINNEKNLNEENKISADVKCDDSGIGLDLDKSRMSSTEEMMDEADGQTNRHGMKGKTLQKDLQDGGSIDKAEIYGEKEPSVTIQPKRRFSDLDVHLKMMGDKAYPFFQPNPEEYPEIDGPTNTKDIAAESDQLELKHEVQTDNCNQEEESGLSLKQDSHLESKENNDVVLTPVLDVDIDNTSKEHDLKPDLESVNENSTDKEVKNSEQEDKVSKTENPTEEKDDKEETEATEKDPEDADLLDDMLEYLKNNRKGSRRSMTTDSGLGDDDYRDSSPDSDWESQEHRRKRSQDNTDHHSKAKPSVLSKQLNKMKIPKILIEESDEVEEHDFVYPEVATESHTEVEPTVAVPEVLDSPRSHTEEVNEMDKENIEPIQKSQPENVMRVEVDVNQGNNNIESIISANVISSEEAPCSKVDLIEEKETEVEENEKREIQKQDLHVPIVHAELESDIETASEIGNMTELYETADDTEYEKRLATQVESDLGTSMESITNKDDDERLRILGRRYELNTSSRESSMPVSDYDFQCRKDSLRNDRRSTLRKQYMIVDSDEDDDTHSLRPVHDDDYFASTESLGIGVSRESLDKTFSQLELLCGEVIPETDENVLSRSGSRDDGCDPTENDNKGFQMLDKNQQNPNIFTECSESAYSESLSSEPEDIEDILSKKAKEIQQEMDTLSLAWREEESVENQMSNDVEKLQDTKPEVPNQIIHTEVGDKVQIKSRNQSFVRESERPQETTEDSFASSPLSEKAKLTELNEDSSFKAKLSNKEVSSTRENVLKEREGKLNAIEDISEEQMKMAIENEKDSLFAQANKTKEQIQESLNTSSTDSTKQEKSTVNEQEPVEQVEEGVIASTDSAKQEQSSVTAHKPGEQVEEGIIVPQLEEPKETIPKFVDLPKDAIPQQPSDEFNILADVDTDEMKYRTPMDDFLMSTSKVSSKRKQTRPIILSASSDVTIKEGQCLVLEWEITGNPEPKVELYKDGALPRFCNGDGLFHDSDFVTLEVLHSSPSDTGCYELHLTNELGTDVSLINVIVTENSREGSLVWEKPLERANSPPTFTVTPGDVKIIDGQTIVLKASVDGYPKPSIQWLKDDDDLQESAHCDVIEEATYSCLVIPNPTQEHVGQYICRAVNTEGVCETVFAVTMDMGDEMNNMKPLELVEPSHVKPIFENLSEGTLKFSPKVRLEITESEDSFCKKFEVCSKVIDALNDVILEKGDVVDVLDRTKGSHWLVRKEHAKDEVCYASPENLKPCLGKERTDPKELESNVCIEKVEEKKRKLVQDLLDSETDYVCDLRDLIENYFDVADDEFPDKSKGKDIFRNVEALYQFHHKKLLPELIAAKNEPEKVAYVFLKKRESFSEYLPYLAGKNKAGESLESKELKKFLQDYSKSIGDESDTLQELLDRPVERIHEYMDLLKNLIKFTKAGGGDCVELLKAVSMLSDICREVENIMLLDNMEGWENPEPAHCVISHETATVWSGEAEVGEDCHIFLFPEKMVIARSTEGKDTAPGGVVRLKFDQEIQLRTVALCEDDSGRSLALWDASLEDEESPASFLTLETSSPFSKQTLVRDIQEAQEKLGVNVEKPSKMPEHRKIATKTPKVKSSAVKRAETADNVSLASSDDFKIIDTSHDIQPEFEDGTTRPIFRKKLKKTVVSENSTARLECVVVGIPQPKVLWLKNNRPLKSTDMCRVLSEGNVHVLEFPKTKKEDTGLYTARAMNVNGSTISSAELLVGNAQPSSLKKYKEGLAEEEFQTPAYFFQMNSCQVEEGRLARFDCRVVAHPKPEITWMKDGKVVQSGDRYKLLNYNNEIYSLLVQNVEMGDTGRYTCWAHNKYGEAMTEAYLNVIALEEQLEDADIAPKFLTKFYDQTITEGLPTTFQCMIAGKPMPVVRWLLNDLEIKSSDNVQIQQQENICSLSIRKSLTKDAGTYSCHLKNSLGEAVCSAGLTMLDQSIKGVPMLPKFLKRIDDVTSTAGGQMVYEVVAVGEPKPKVSWLYNHKPISETHRRFQMSQEADTYKLTLNDLRQEDEGKITCKAVNSEGEVYCSSKLTVKRAPMEFKEDQPSFRQKDFDAKYGCAPTFIKRMENIYAADGKSKSAKFECKVMGIPEPNVTWYKDNKPLTPGSHYWINRDGGNCTLTIRDVMDSDTGQYTCKINNPAGETSCTASLELPSTKMKKDSSVDGEYSPFARRFSRDSTKSDHEAVPTLPYDKPSLTDIREESVRLSWLPAYTSTLPPEGKNVKYIIEARELPGFDWHKVATGIHGNTHMVKNLRPNTEYAFRVHAENQFGTSDSTQPVMLSRPKPVEEEIAEKFHVKPHESRVPPKLPSSKPFVTEMGQETVRLAWKPAVAPVAAKKVAPISYRLEAQELPAKDWIPVAHRIRDTSYYLPELKSDRDYNIRVRAENKYGQSESSEPLWIPRATHFPGVPVSRPTIVDMESDSVRVAWQKVDIPSFSASDEPLLYMLEMQEPPKHDWRPIARDIPDLNYTVRGLTPGQDYRFRVKTRPMGGAYGEPSPSTSLYRTLATTRIPIDRLELEDTEPDFEGVRLAWNRVEIPPYHSDEEPLLYMVEMNEPPLDEWRPVVSGLPTTRYRVTDLLPDRDYRFRVRAITPYGVTPPSYALPVSYRRPVSVPSRGLPDMPRLQYDESDALKLTWKPPVVDTKRPLRYQIQMQAPQSLDWRPLASGITDTSYRIRGLGPSRDYTFRIIPETSLGPLQPLPPVSLTALPAPRSVLPRMPDIFDLEPDSLRLSWQRPYIDSTLPISYRIDVQEPPSREWRPIATGVPDTQYHVTGLRPNKDYLFRVTPRTPTYDMEPLPYVTLTSLPVRPRLFSQEPRVVERGKDSVQLTWRPAELPYFARHKQPIRYAIEMRTLPSANWEPVARNVQDTTYLVKGLRPEKEYQFRIKAHTDFGSSEPSLPATIYRKPVPVFPRYEPILTNLNPDSVVLSWQPATLPGNISHMPMVTYRIEIQDPPERGHWRTYVSNVPKTSYHVTNLRPDRDYLFRIRAEADNIMTEPCMPVYLPRRASPPRMPQEQPYVFELQPNSLKLQWRSVELPSRITDYSPVTYRLEVQELPRSDWMTLAKGIPHTDFHVTHLNPDKDYRFRVRAENDMGISDPTPEVCVRKRAVAPSMPQEESLIYDIGPSGSFWLSWRPADVPLYLADSSPVTYTIYVQEPPSTTWRPLVKRIPHPFYHITNLRNDKDYSFRVQAENEFGLSRPTLPIKMLGIKSWTSPVDIPEITDIDDTSHSLRLKWRPRSVSPFSKGPITYQIERWEPGQRNWTRLATGIRDTTYQVKGLPFDQDHLFRIRAEAEKVLSEPTYPISFNRFRLPSRFPVPRPQLYDVEPDAVRLSWLPLPKGNVEDPIILPRRYRLELRELPSHDWRPVAHDIADTSYRVTGLKPRQDYEFRVRGVSEEGPGSYTKPIALYRRPVLPSTPIGTPKLVAVKEDYVDLRWTLVDVPAHSYDEEPLAFLIEAQTPPRYDWKPVARNVRGTSYRISNLQRHQDYLFRVRAEYPSGLSSPSPHIPVYRKPIRPGIPIARPEIWEEEPHQARLRWRHVYIPPYENLDVPLKYQIEVQEPPLKNWRTLVKGLSMTEHTITDLAPRKDYLFRIRAETPNGDVTEPTPPIAYYRSRLPMTREPSKVYEYKVFEQDYSVPSRSYIDHLTTYIPPRLPIEKPELYTISPESVTLTWKRARVPDKIRDTCNLSYTVEVRNPPNLDWRELVTGLTTTNTDLKGLHPRLDYLFRIRAWNEYGCSEPSLPVSLHRPIELSDDYDSGEDWDEQYRVTLGDLAPPKLPMETPRITDSGETAMLSWLPARIPAYAKKTPITYIIEIKEPHVPGWSRLTSGISDTSYFIEGLRPTQDYQFRVKAETQYGVSDPTLPASLDRPKEKGRRLEFLPDMEYYELFKRDWNTNSDKNKRPSVDLLREDIDLPIKREPTPSGVPPRIPSSRPLITQQLPDRLSMSWMPARVPSYVKNQKLTYVVEIREPPSTLWRSIKEDLRDTEYDVSDLNPDQDYLFRVRARNEYGLSEPTMPASVIRNKDDYVPHVSSRSGSFDSGSPWIRSRASSVESLRKQKSFDFTDDESDIYINREKKACPPEFKSTNEDVHYGVAGTSCKVTLGVKGYPLPTTSWFFMGAEVDYGDNFKAHISPSGNATLEIIKLTRDLIGEYKCTAENEHGTATKIIKLELADQPTVLDPLSDLTLDSHQSGKLVCRVDGLPYPTVKFLKDSRPLTSTSRLRVDYEPPDTWTLTLDKVITTDSGTYTCVAENMAGKSTCSAKITVEENEDHLDRDLMVKPLPYRETFMEDHYHVLEEIGRGRHGIVHRVLDKFTGSEYAAKFIHVCDEHQRRFFRTELNILRWLNQQGVPKLVDAFITERRIVIITEIVTNYDIIDRVLQDPTPTESLVATNIKQLLLVIKELHKASILHLDIKPSNIRFSSNTNLTLIDFGFSERLQRNEEVKKNYGTAGFCSPEQVHNEAVTEASDVWAIGATVYTMLTGLPPFPGSTQQEVLQSTIQYRWQEVNDLSPEANDFLSKILIRDPKERMTVDGCLSHPWIKNAESQGGVISRDRLSEFQTQYKLRCTTSATRGPVRLQPLLSVLEGKQETGIHVDKDSATGELSFPESGLYGEFLDQESWFDWQSRYYYGLDADESDTELESVCGDPILKKEREWLQMAAEEKKQLQRPQDFFPKEEEEEDNPQFTIKLHDTYYRPGDVITLSCHVTSSSTLSVSWFQNEELVTDGKRMKTSLTEEGIATLVITSAKAYDDGIYKCTARNKTGKSSTYARVMVGETPPQPGRPVISQISSCDVLLLWEPPENDGNSDIISYRVDYRQSGSDRWCLGTYSINECALVTGLSPSTSYRFRVCCTNNVGDSPYSVSSVLITTKPKGSADISLDPFTISQLSRQHEGLSFYQPPKNRLSPEDISSREITLQTTNVEDQYSLSNVLWRGNYSSSYVLSTDKTKKLHNITKITPVSDLHKDRLSRELEILRTLRHERFVQLYDAYLYMDRYYWIMEYLSGVNVVEHFSYKSKYTEDMVAIVIRQVLDGLQFLHYHGYAHLNIQPSSVMMVSRRRLDVRIVDFSLVQKVTKEGQVVPREGNPEFMAPEVVVKEMTSYPADIWSVGVLTFLLLSGESPYKGQDEEATFTNVAYNRYNALSLYENITKEALKFIFRVLKRVSRNRMTASECLDDKWLQTSETMLKFRTEAVFSSVKLRNYVTESFLESIKASEAELTRLREKFLIRQEVKVTKKAIKEDSKKTDQHTDSGVNQTMKKEVKDSEIESEVKRSEVKKSSSVEDIADELVNGAMDEALKSETLT
ncbi:titin-like isoform X3 [Saccostrea cucullata]|uniref:titin-like isoform X3 n=1 Tax=Saccostrea cuccullata TaxID=36930 RepID=UPI002ED58FEA